MKRVFVLMVAMCFVVMSLTSCGSSGYSGGYSSGSYMNGMTTDSYAEDVYYDGSGYNYGGTYISGDDVDYSYTFSAGGNTSKTRQDMLDYYEELQALVDKNDGYIQDVDNRYTSYTIDSGTYISNRVLHYKATGELRFTIQIDNEYVPLIFESLEKFCKDNKFEITAYNQRITNYINYNVVPDGTDIDWYDRGHTITDSELARRLAYADFYVTISYAIPRGWFEVAGLSIREMASDIWDSFGSVVTGCIVMIFAFAILFVAGLEFYKAYKRAVYKYRTKHPEYYPPKEVVYKEADKK